MSKLLSMTFPPCQLPARSASAANALRRAQEAYHPGTLHGLRRQLFQDNPIGSRPRLAANKTKEGE